MKRGTQRTQRQAVAMTPTTPVPAPITSGKKLTAAGRLGVFVTVGVIEMVGDVVGESVGVGVCDDPKEVVGVTVMILEVDTEMVGVREKEGVALPVAVSVTELESEGPELLDQE